MKISIRSAAVVGALALVLTGCGDTDPTEPAESASAAAPTAETPSPAASSADASSAEPSGDDMSTPAPHSNVAEEGVDPANPAPEDIPAGALPSDEQATTDQAASAQASSASADLSAEALRHFELGGVCFTDDSPLGHPSPEIVQEISDYCETTDGEDWNPEDGAPNPLGMPDPVE